jgi:hypothetical protein
MNNLNQLPEATYRLMLPMNANGLGVVSDTLTLPQGALMTWREGQAAVEQHRVETGELLTLYNTGAC